MKRVLVVGLVAIMAACDPGVSDPSDEPITVRITVTGASASPIGAVLLSADHTMDGIVVFGGRGLLSPTPGGTLLAAVPGEPAATISFTVKATGTVPGLQLLQVAGPDNALYTDFTAFSVDAREVE